jgi:hypothetical protein
VTKAREGAGGEEASGLEADGGVEVGGGRGHRVGSGA